MRGNGGKVWGNEDQAGPVQLLTGPFPAGSGIDALLLQTHVALGPVGNDTVVLFG